MVTKCNQIYQNSTYKTLCESPGTDNDMDSIIPVTDLNTYEVYRNKYCFYCNNIDVNTLLVAWEASVVNEKEINERDSEFLDKLKAHGGNIIFNPPEFTTTKTCDIFLPTFEISSCNVTGLWPVYSHIIEKACESYIDPFNNTYKNYFCYLCNIAEQLPIEQWDCVENNKSSGTINITPPFSAILDITVLESDMNRVSISCTRNQFPDDKKVRLINTLKSW